jgi:hypothetical protein
MHCPDPPGSACSLSSSLTDRQGPPCRLVQLPAPSVSSPASPVRDPAPPPDQTPSTPGPPFLYPPPHRRTQGPHPLSLVGISASMAIPSPLSFPLQTLAARAPPPPVLNIVTPSRWCSSTRTPSRYQNWAGEPPPLPCHPLLVIRPYAPLLLQLIGLPHLPRHPRDAGPRHHCRTTSEHCRPQRNTAGPPHPPPHWCTTPIDKPATILLA